MAEDLISIVIPIYNVEQYLADCLDSVCNQKYQNLEILLVNDGSTDGSFNICQRYATSDKRIRMFSQKNAGLSAARNTGILNATGKYITFIDSDDVVASTYISKLYRAIQENQADIAIGEYESYCDETPSFTENESVTKCMNGVEAVDRLISQNYITFVTAWGTLYKLSLFDDIKFPEGKLHEDEYTTYQLYLKSSCVVHISDVIYGYRQRPGSIMRENLDVRIKDSMMAVLDRLQVLESYGIESIVLHRYAFVRQFSRPLYLLKQQKSTKLLYDSLYKIWCNEYDTVFWHVNLKRKMILFLLRRCRTIYYTLKK